MALEPRKRYFHGAIDVSAMGMNEPKSHGGDYYPSVEASPIYNATLETGLTSGQHIIGWLSPGMVWDTAAVANHVAAGAITAEIGLLESSSGAGDDVVIVAAAGLSAAGAITTVANFAPTAKRQLLYVTLSGAASAVPMLSLYLKPLVPEWQ